MATAYGDFLRYIRKKRKNQYEIPLGNVNISFCTNGELIPY